MDLPEAARAELVAWRAAAFHGRDDLRLVDPAALHVTLVFLGHLPEAQIGRIAELVREAVPAGATPTLSAAGVKPLPPRRPRLFALDLADEDARAGFVQGAVSNALHAAGLYEPEQRAFWPHVTLARARRGARPGMLGAEPPPAATWRPEMLDAEPPPAAPWKADAVTLYRSRLSPRGAQYEALERIPL